MDFSVQKTSRNDLSHLLSILSSNVELFFTAASGVFVFLSVQRYYRINVSFLSVGANGCSPEEELITETER